MVKHIRQAGGFDGCLQHDWVAIAQNTRGDALGLERDQHAVVFRKSTQVPVLVHQLLDLCAVMGIKYVFCPVFVVANSYFFDSKYQCSTGQLPEWLVHRFTAGAALAGGDQPGVFNLLVTPHHAQGLAVAGEQLLGQHANAVHIKQRAVSVEQDGFDVGFDIDRQLCVCARTRGLHPLILLDAGGCVDSSEINLSVTCLQGCPAS